MCLLWWSATKACTNGSVCLTVFQGTTEQFVIV